MQLLCFSSDDLTGFLYFLFLDFGLSKVFAQIDGGFDLHRLLCIFVFLINIVKREDFKEVDSLFKIQWSVTQLLIAICTGCQYVDIIDLKTNLDLYTGCFVTSDIFS